jgi:hypothetical protein
VELLIFELPMGGWDLSGLQSLLLVACQEVSPTDLCGPSNAPARNNLPEATVGALMTPTALVMNAAQAAFAERRYFDAVRLLEGVERPSTSLKELLARSYFGAAMLERAEEAARDLVEADPAGTYARVLLVRTLERQSRHEEAARERKLARAMGCEA